LPTALKCSRVAVIGVSCTPGRVASANSSDAACPLAAGGSWPVAARALRLGAVKPAKWAGSTLGFRRESAATGTAVFRRRSARGVRREGNRGESAARATAASPPRGQPRRVRREGNRGESAASRRHRCEPQSAASPRRPAKRPSRRLQAQTGDVGHAPRGKRPRPPRRRLEWDVRRSSSGTDSSASAAQ
jgi:hypothetical protein